MPIEETLRRVDDDLAHGRVVPALNRLNGLVRSTPGRLDVRERLAAVYRSQAEAAQAGRWSFLSEEPDTTEVAAFERQFPRPARRLDAPAWHDDAPLGPQATARLAALREQADTDGTGHQDDDGGDLGCAVAAVVGGLVAVLVIALLVVGAITVVRWLTG